MKVSVIVPAYGRVDQTVRTVELLLASEGVGTAFDLELILSDSSLDDSLQQAAVKFGSTIFYTKPQKSGKAASKNHGVQAATGSIIIFCDADVEVEKNTLRNALAYLEKHPMVAAVGGRVVWRGGDRDGHRDRPRPEDRMLKTVQAVYTEAIYSRFIATYKKIFTAVGAYDDVVFPLYGEGADLSIRYWRAGFPLAYDESLSTHRIYHEPEEASLHTPQSGMVRDLFLLAYKYNMLEGDMPNFMATVEADLASLGKDRSYRLMQAIAQHLDVICGAKSSVDEFRKKDIPVFDFKFLEVFSNAEAFNQCLAQAPQRIGGIL